MTSEKYKLLKISCLKLHHLKITFAFKITKNNFIMYRNRAIQISFRVTVILIMKKIFNKKIFKYIFENSS